MGSAPFARKFAERRVSAVALATTLSRCEEAGGGRRLVLKEHEAYRFASGFRSRWNSTPSWALAAAPAGGQQERGRGGVPGPAAPAEERGVPVGSVPPRGRVPAQLGGSGLAGRDRQPPRLGPTPASAWSHRSQMGHPGREERQESKPDSREVWPCLWLRPPCAWTSDHTQRGD